MYKSLFAGICLIALAACGAGVDQADGGGGDPIVDPDAGPNGIPKVLNENLHGATYNAAAGTLTLNMVSLDAGPVEAVYTRKPGLDIGRYQAYTNQDDPLDRHFTALVAQIGAANNSVQAGVVADGGQFNRYFPGAYYQRDGAYTPPPNASGLVSYAGLYAGVTNVASTGSDLLPIPGPGPIDAQRVPRQSARTQGHIFLNVNFSDNSVNGNINNRTLIDAAGLPANTPIPNVVLIRSDIDANGEFLGSSEYDDANHTGNGSYGGIFGGVNANAVGGVVALENFDGPGDLLGYTAEQERGVFVLLQCGQPGDDPICANVNP